MKQVRTECPNCWGYQEYDEIISCTKGESNQKK